MFVPRRITQTTTVAVTEEFGKLNYLLGDIGNVQGWNCYKSNGNFRGAISSLKNRVSSQAQRVQVLSEVTLISLQDNMLAGNYDWFVADSYQQEFEDLVARYKSQCSR